MKKIVTLKNIDKIYGFDNSFNKKIYENFSIISCDGKISSIIPSDKYDEEIKKIFHNDVSDFVIKEYDCKNKICLPSFVDAHTHLIYAGDRSNEFFKRNRGVSYLKIAEEGGGISYTVKKTREASDEELLHLLLKRIKKLSSFGVTHVEIKSGYGLSVKDELRLLEIIDKVKKFTNINITPTCMPAHDFPPEAKKDERLKENWIEQIIKEILPEVKRRKLAKFFDIFTEEKVFNYNQTERLCKAAIDNGFKIKMHVNELSNINALKLALELNATSVEHLLQTTEEEVMLFKNSNTVPVLLPATAFYLNERYAPFNLFEKHGVDIALASDSNPGSNCTENILMVYTIAAIKLHMEAYQILKASTITAAKALDLKQYPGVIEEGFPADFIIVDVPSLEYLYYHYGDNPIEKVFIDGEEVFVNGI
ncbi:MAG TPA: imidazolonepropionase [Exilispira sp.]|nr:imidazolonepropionase [Exilispira sp.]